jgi:hypothetical protein
MLFQIIYISKSTKLMQGSDLSVLLDESRSWNQAHDITGMLLYIQGKFLNDTEGRFIQVLEGTEEEVKGIFKKIKTDHRHHSVTALTETKIPSRNFKHWSMGFERLNLEKYNELEGSFNLNKAFLNRSSTKLNVSLSFLQSFYAMSLGMGDEKTI